MQNKDFCFTKWLTKKDIKQILELNNMELAEDCPHAIHKYHTENGETAIIVAARNKEVLPLGQMVAHTLPLIAGAFMQEYGQGGFNNLLVELDDFTMVELGCTFLTDEKALEYNRKLTKNYHKFMHTKFGDFYNTQKAKYIKELNKEEQEKQIAKESETEKEV